MQVKDRVGGMLRLDDFRPVKRLGFGATGCVHLAELKGTSCFFAIKAVDKADLVAQNKVGGWLSTLASLRRHEKYGYGYGYDDCGQSLGRRFAV